MPTSWPTSSDVSAMLTTAGLVGSTDTFDYHTAIQAAIEEFEHLTGRRPFLRDAADVTRRYDPPGPRRSGFTYATTHAGGGIYLPLDAGLLTVTAVYAGWDGSSGSALTEGTDYILHPANAAAMGLPYDAIEFLYPMFGGRRSIAVVGKWGYSATVPYDVWEAVRGQAAANLAPQIAASISRGVISWKEADVAEEYGAKPLEHVVGQWRQAFVDAARHHAIVRL